MCDVQHVRKKERLRPKKIDVELEIMYSKADKNFEEIARCAIYTYIIYEMHQQYLYNKIIQKLSYIFVIKI